jgi:hypothetical protein
LGHVSGLSRSTSVGEHCLSLTSQTPHRAICQTAISCNADPYLSS